MPKISCPNCKSEIFVSIKPRSLKENNYYWGIVLTLLAEATGFTPEEAHDAMRWKFLRKGQRFETVRSTTGLTTNEFEEYLEKIRLFAAQELNCIIPLPNENKSNICP